MSQDGACSSPIDRLSSLPNEILDHIFHCAYIDTIFWECKSQPISKHLLPFHQRVLLHTFSPTKWKSVRLFNLALARDPSMIVDIKRVSLEYLYIKSWEGDGTREAKHSDWLVSLLRSVSNVEELVFAGDPCDMALVFWKQVDENPKLFPKLRSLHMEILDEDHGKQSPLTGLSPLRHLHTLTQLTVSWPFASNISSTHCIHLPLVKELHFEGEGSGEPSNLALILSCPSVNELDFYEVLGNNDQALDAIIPNIPQNISENLSTLTVSGQIRTPIDLYLSRFIHLRYLELGADSYGLELARHLSPLSLLEHLSIDTAQHDLQALDAILDGPYRLNALRILGLNFKLGERGGRIDPDVKREKGVWEDFWVWGAPRYDGVQVQTLEVLIEKAGVRDITVYGEGTTARKAIEVYLVELFNRSVLDSGTDGGHERIEIAYSMASEYNYTLPRFSLDRVDLVNGRIVKIPLPDQDWFVLGIEPKKAEDIEHYEET